MREKAMVTEEKLDELIEYLGGSCNSWHEGLYAVGIEDESLTDADYNYVYDQIFQCGSCNWWCDASEEVDDGICKECWEDEQDDEN
jgi:hypothetical protein